MHNSNHSVDTALGRNVLTQAECEALFNALHDDASAGVARDIATLVLRTGLRTGELSQLRAGDINLDTNVLTIPPSKAWDVRSVPFDGVAANILKERVQGRSESEFVFGNSTVEMASRKLARIAKATLGRTVSLHHLRHTFATTMVCAGLSIDALASICGWKLNSSLKRICALTPASLRREYEGAISAAKRDN